MWRNFERSVDQEAAATIAFDGAFDDLVKEGADRLLWRQGRLEAGDALARRSFGIALQYLAEKTGKFLPQDLHGRIEVMQWLFWQMGGLGPIAGQNHHFRQHAPEKIPYAIERYVNETHRLYGVLDRRLADRDFVAGDYSIADMASYPWVVPYERQGQKLDDFPNLKRWFETIRARPAVVRAYELAKKINVQPTVSDESRSVLFGQTATTAAQ